MKRVVDVVPLTSSAFTAATKKQGAHEKLASSSNISSMRRGGRRVYLVIIGFFCMTSFLVSLWHSSSLRSGNASSSEKLNSKAVISGNMAAETGGESKRLNTAQGVGADADSPVPPRRPDPLLNMAAHDEALDRLLGSRATKFNRTFFTYLDVPSSKHNRVRRMHHTPPAVPFLLPKGVCVDCYQLLSVRPRVYLFRNVFTSEEADKLRALGDPLLIRSGVFAKHAIQRSVRSSFGARLPNSDPTATALNERLMFMINHFSANRSTREFRAGFAERLEMLRYEGSQTYYGHLDNFGGLDGPIARDRAKKVRMYSRTLEELHEVTSLLHSIRKKRSASVAGGAEASLRTNGSTAADVKGGIVVEQHHTDDDGDARSVAERQQELCAALWKQYAPIKDPLLDRGATMISFLNTINESVTPGGHTTFPYAIAGDGAVDGLLPRDKNWTADLKALPDARLRWRIMLNAFRSAKDSACKANRTGAPTFLSLKPVVGDVVLFYDTYPNGVSDPFALHSGCPPISEDELVSAANAALLDMPSSAPKEEHELDAFRQKIKLSLSKRHVKVIATKWFMLPIIDGVRKPPSTLCSRPTGTPNRNSKP
jgi:hypothetical protein